MDSNSQLALVKAVQPTGSTGLQQRAGRKRPAVSHQRRTPPGPACEPTDTAKMTLSNLSITTTIST
jgi:hypothetical protein